MLKGGGDDVLLALLGAEPGGGNDGLVIGLAAAGGEDDLPGLATQTLSHGGTGGVQSLLGLLSQGVQGRGVAVNLGQVGHHRVNGNLAGGGGCRIIRVNSHI